MQVSLELLLTPHPLPLLQLRAMRVLSLILKTINSPSTYFTGTAASSSTEDDEFGNGGRRKGTLSSLIYGTKEGREMEKEIEQSFSQVLARGKYVHSIVFHEVKPDKVDEYVELVGGWYPKMAAMPENKVHLVGSWRTEVGDCETFGIAPPSTPFFFPAQIGVMGLSIQLLIFQSSYLGISTLPWLPRLAAFDCLPSRLSSL